MIDPPLIYSTYYGGTGLDYAYAVAVDSIGNTYVAGGDGLGRFRHHGNRRRLRSQVTPQRL